MALNFKDSLALTQILSDSSKEDLLATNTLAQEGYGAATAEEKANYDMHTPSGIEYNQNYPIYDVFADNDISVINANKGMTVNTSQFNLTEERNSQYIPFSMPRYCDGYDLANGVIWIITDAAKGDGTGKNEYAVQPVNVYVDKNKVYFGWLVDGYVTRKAGTINFEIHVHGQVQGIKDGKEVISGYVWKTKTSVLNVSASKFNIDDMIADNITTKNENWLDDIVTTVVGQIVDLNFQDVFDAKDAAEAAQKATEEIRDTILSEAVAAAEVEAIAATEKRLDAYEEEFVKTFDSLVTEYEHEQILGYEDKYENGKQLTVKDYVAKELVETIGDFDNENISVKSYIDEAVKDVTESSAADAATKVAALEASTTSKFTALEADIEHRTTVLNENIQQAKSDSVDYVEERLGNLGIDEEEKLKTVADAIDEAIISASDYTDAALSDKLGKMVFDNGEIVVTGETVTDFVQSAIQAVDISDTIGDLTLTVKDEDGTEKEIVYTNVTEFVEASVDAVDVTEQLKDYATLENLETAIQDADISNKLVNYALKTDVKTLSDTVDVLSDTVDTIQTDLGDATNRLAVLDLDVQDLKTEKAYTYNVNYNSNSGLFSFYQYTDEENQAEDPEYPAKNSFTIVGGGGGGASANTYVTINRITLGSYAVPDGEDAIIRYNVEAKADGEDVTELVAKWQVGGKTVKTETITPGENTFDATKYLTTTPQTVFLSVTYVDIASGEVAASSTKDWKAYFVKLSIESDFDDSKPQSGGVNFTYRPNGSGKKEIHFILDGKELEPKIITAESGQTYFIEKQSHGSHLLEIYATLDLGAAGILESNHVFKDIMWYDAEIGTPIISAPIQNFTVRQYESVKLEYSIYVNEKTEFAEAILESYYVNENGERVLEYSNPVTVATRSKQAWTYKSDKIGKHVLTITVGDVVKTLTANIVELGISADPVSGDSFDFNPIGYSNTSANKLWSYTNEQGETYSMTVSDNFDWINGGYQTDEQQDQYFCVKAGTTATINYNLFANDPKGVGKEFKVIFRTKNIRKRDTSFLKCMDQGIGLDMKIENATVYDSLGSLKSNYCEDAIIEYEFNINKFDEMPIIMAYEDGTPAIPREYGQTSSFKQASPQPIVIGSPDCDVHIYRMKAYPFALRDDEVLANFIADARNPEEMISRYERNQIYTNGELVSTSANGDFSAEALMKAAPELRYIFLEIPEFTTDKDIKIDNCTVYFRYPNGTRPEDNWICTGVRHRGQGTSSNEYGYAGRNIDLCMDRDESMFSWTDEEGRLIESRTVTLTDGSVPTDYLNIKVNIASSENTNNAQMAQRYNLYQPFLRYARKKDSKVKDTMEFFNCVLFIRETSELENHKEFNDNKWHFYAIGNVGDSKKTDDTRVNNKKDPKEHVIEITDVDKLLSSFPKGEGEWGPGNSAYDILYSNEYIYDDKGAFESFGAETYEFRYECEGTEENPFTAEDREKNIATWRDFYSFVVTSTDDDFKAKLKNYFVVDSALYYYLFTERYTMVDNRAKNSFWHYGKVYISKAEAAEMGETEASYYIIDDEAAAIRNGYRYDLTFGYDFDTALGIDNTGNFVFPYGKEDTDRYDNDSPESPYVFRAADSTFFCRLRDLFPEELKNMYKNREAEKAWDANPGLITQWDRCQAQFPEELWRLDYERKYYRTYCGKSIDNSIPKGVEAKFLTKMFFGRKKYSRRSFESNQEIYFASKYFGTAVCSSKNNIALRCTKHDKANYSLTLVPYSDMYVCVQYGSKGNPIHIKTKAGESCTFESNLTDLDFLYVYGASHIQEMSDLSRCYLGDQNDFSKGIRLRRLIIGNPSPDYNNPFFKKITVGNNPLLEYLDLTNVSGLSESLDFTACGNLKEVRAKGTNVNSVTFANSGLLETAYVPKIKSLVMRNLSHLKDFICDGYDHLETLVVENTPALNTYSIINNAPMLKTLRLIGMNWDASYQISNTSIFDRMSTIGGYNSTTSEELDPPASLDGYAYVLIINDFALNAYNQYWPNLTIDYPPGAMNKHTPVYFYNEKGDTEPLEIQQVLQGSRVIEPTKRVENPLPIPTKESSVQENFTFKEWVTEDGTPYQFNPQTGESIFPVGSTPLYLYASYDSSKRTYHVEYVVNRSGILDPQQITEQPVEYGTYVPYTGKLPTYSDEEGPNGTGNYYVFEGWDKSGLVWEGPEGNDLKDGKKVITAKFSQPFNYFDNTNVFINRELVDLTPAEIYGLTRVGLAVVNNNGFGKRNEQTGKPYGLQVKDPYRFYMGRDVEYSDIQGQELLAEEADDLVFTGASVGGYAEKYVDTGVYLIDQDKDFVLAIDFTMTGDGTLASCILQNYGFQLRRNGDYAEIVWHSDSTKTVKVAKLNEREIIVLRHIAGTANLHVYSSNLGAIEPTSALITREQTGTDEVPLVFGAAISKDQNSGRFSYIKAGSGIIHWAKVWWKDLGDALCKELVGWTHEEIALEVDGFNRYFVTNGGGATTTMSLLGSKLLDRKMSLNTTSANAGGYPAWSIYRILNERFYKAMPYSIQSIVKPVDVKYTIGMNKNEVSESPGSFNVLIPTVYDLRAKDTDLYKAESCETPISYFTANDTNGRIRCHGNSNEGTPYWTRSTVYNSTNLSFYNTRVYSITETGAMSQEFDPTAVKGILIELSF